MKTRPPLLVDRGLLGTGPQDVDAGLARALAELNRADRPLVLLAERPDRWTPTRNRVDRALEGQSLIEREIHKVGGMLDAILYLDLGLFSRRRKREAALDDLANRYGCSADALVAVVRPGRLADGLRKVVGEIRTVDNASELRRQIGEFI